ncbi:ABC transporter permease [bacterium]|nr:ABC transporter permease [bacterium]
MSNPTERQHAWRAMLADYLGMAVVIVALILVFSLLARNFFQAATFRTIANEIPDRVIVAVGMTFVLIIAGIDLSVGSVLAVSSAVLGVCMAEYGWPLALAIPACLAVGLACGAANGLVSVGWRIPSFIVTLGMLEVARGAAYLVTGSRTQYIGSRIEVVADASVLGLSVPFVLALAIVAAGQFVLSRTVFGRHLIAIGTNEEAVRLSGIDPRPRKLAVYMLCGLLTALAAVVHTSRLASANPNAGVGFELEAIAAVVIGGTSLMGGRGSVVRSFLGVVIIAILSSGLNQLGAQEPTKRVITGAVIVAAVIADHYRHRLGSKSQH